jgi:hypothetical protein
MSKKLIAAAVTAIGIFAGNQHALADDKLFKSYAYDSAITEYTQAKGYYDCSKDVGGTAMCIDNVDFIDKKFTAALIFSGSKLVQVSLVSPFDQELYAGTAGVLAKSFSLVSLTDGKSVLDLVEVASKSTSNDDFAAKFSNYESVGLSAGNMTYTFLEGTGSLKGYKTAVSLLQAAPTNTRCAELVVRGEGAESVLIVRFSFPKLETDKMLQAAKKPAESF